MRRVSNKTRKEPQIKKQLDTFEKNFVELRSQDQWIKDVIHNNIPYTTTGVLAMYDLVKTVEHIVKSNLVGDMVECGVYMGGSCRLIMDTLNYLNDKRTVWMYDTYNGVPFPGDTDMYHWEEHSNKNMQEWFIDHGHFDDGVGTTWCYSSLDDVKENISSVNYQGNVEFIKGKVEDTIPEIGPNNISLLRIDVDLAEPTRHILDHFYNRVSEKGHVIFDDYGFNPTLRTYVDNFISNNGNPFMYRINRTVQHLVK